MHWGTATTGRTRWYGWAMASWSIRDERSGLGVTNSTTPRDAMQVLKSQTFRIVMFLSALASSSIVLMAGRRW